MRILSGDSEHYPVVVYKAEILTAFKGVGRGERLYFGPFIGYGAGGEYLTFLQRSKDGVKPSDEGGESGLHYGPIGTLYRVMYQGYNVMPSRSVCMFDGKPPNERCDYGIKVDTYQVKLPRTPRTYPLERDDESANNKKWVRRDAPISLLDALRTAATHGEKAP